MNKIILDGKEYELSAELVVQIKAEVALQEIERKMSENPFVRTIDDKTYFYINEGGEVKAALDRHFSVDDLCFEIANYCSDKGMMEQRALHETLNRLLWRYSETNGGGEKRGGYFIYRSNMEDMRVGHCTYATCGDVYFRKKEVAEAAIEEVVKPFIAAHPEFVW